MRWLLLIALIACAGSNSETGANDEIGEGSQGDETAMDWNRPAGHDEVCHRGELSETPGVSRPCAEGLQCCYPCGTRGCDSVCHTEQECREDMMRP